MKKRSQPPGFRFQPTHVELVVFYLKRKVMNMRLPSGVISELDIYKYAPWDLPDMSCMKSGDLKWYFFCPREKKYASGGRMNRATEFGYWKSTGKDRPVSYNNVEVGQIKTLTFFRGKAPKGAQTDWVMHEYRIDEKNLSINNVAQDAYVLCVIFQKDGPGPRNGAQYGAPFIEDEWDVDSMEEVDSVAPSSVLSALPCNEPPISFALNISTTTTGNIFGCSSASCISENLASTSKEIPQIASTSTVPVDTPQILDNVDGLLNLDNIDGFTLDDIFPEDDILNKIHADGLQNTIAAAAATNNSTDGDDIFEGLEDIGSWFGATNGDGNEGMLFSSTQKSYYYSIFEEPMLGSQEERPFLELNDLDTPLYSRFTSGENKSKVRYEK